MKRALLIAAIITCVGARHVNAADTTTQPLTPLPRTPGSMQRLSDAQAAQKAQSKLTDEQRKKLQEANQKLHQEQTALYEKLRIARRDLEQAVQAEHYDEQTIRSKAAVLGQLEGDLALIRAKHYQEIRPFMPKPSAVTAARPGVVLTNTPAKAPAK
jgi:Spy/CpxP family protein refolding chaperone